MIEKDKLKNELKIVQRKLKRFKDKKKEINSLINFVSNCQYHYEEDIRDLECDINIIKRFLNKK